MLKPEAAGAPGTAVAPLILASASRYRAELLQRLRLPFTALASAADETPLPDESAAALVQRLALAKARTLAAQHPHTWIIGSDQIAALDGDTLLGKPGDAATARAQLARCAGRSVQFLTAVALLRGDEVHAALDVTTVRFRALDTEAIAHYVDAEPALDCAGSFKCEGYGITLFEAIDSRDPTALIGLPLIATSALLRRAGFRLP